MRCLLVADLHYALRQFDWLVTEARKADVVCLAGDLLLSGSSVAAEAQIAVVQRYLARLRDVTRVIVASGNHDLTGESATGERTAPWINDLAADGLTVDGGHLDIGSLRISACPWWDGPETRAGIARQLAGDARARPDPWIWVYHAPPCDSPTSWGGHRSFGDAALSAWIDEFSPDIVLSGHVHQSPFVAGGSWADRRGTTWVFNPGHQIGPVPAHVVLDIDVARAAWFSLAGAEEVSLNAPYKPPPATLTSRPAWL